ncbi:MAG TPA: hypothetical protein PK402_07060, partial [Tepidisphaeraceae bacterium]|nr:hypothetical protein [Tepidisphaeraceae bacterium]
MSLQEFGSSVNANRTTKNFGAIHLALATAVGVCCSSAFGVTVPYTKALISSFNPNETATPIVQHSNPASPSSLSYIQSGDWGSVSGFASADLSTGQLKVRATSMPEDGQFPSMQTNAWFGDGFRANSPSGPFAWTPDSMSRFTLDLTDSAVTASSDL